MSIYIPWWDVGGNEDTSTIQKWAVGSFRFPTPAEFRLQKLGLKALLAVSLPLLLKHAIKKAISMQVLWFDCGSCPWIIDLCLI